MLFLASSPVKRSRLYAMASKAESCILLFATKILPGPPPIAPRMSRLSCEFCSVAVFNHGKHKARPVDEVLAEIDSYFTRYPAVRQLPIFFIDDNIYANKKNAKELFSRLSGKGIYWLVGEGEKVSQEGTLGEAVDDATLHFEIRLKGRPLPAYKMVKGKRRRSK